MGNKGRFVVVFAVFLVALGFLLPLMWGHMDAFGVSLVLGLTLTLVGLSELVHIVARRLTKSDGLGDKVNEDYRAGRR